MFQYITFKHRRVYLCLVEVAVSAKKVFHYSRTPEFAVELKKW